MSTETHTGGDVQQTPGSQSFGPGFHTPSQGGSVPSAVSDSTAALATATVTSISSSSSASETASNQAVAPATATPTSSPIASSSSKGLSTGAKAGIAVGSVVGFALLLLLAFFLFRSRKKKQQAPLLADDGKNLGVGPSVMSHQDPYTDSPENAPAQNRFSWSQQPAAPMAAVPPASQRYSSGQPAASRDISNEEAAAGGYWQPSASQSPSSPQARKQSDVTAHSRTSMQEARAPPSPAGQSSSYTAYTPAPQTAAAAAPATRHSQRLMDDEWDEDEARLDAEIAEIERMKQMRENRAAMR